MSGIDETLKFSKEFILNPVSISSIIPSSKNLSRLMVSMCGLNDTHTIFEFGCGTGSITGEIVKKAKNKAKILSFDINSNFIEIIEEKYPDVKAINDSVENVEKYMQKYSIDSVDAVISSLPWAAFKSDTQEKLLNVIHNILKPKGEFVTYAYLHTKIMSSHRKFMRLLNRNFNNIEYSSIVWLNLPPAFVIKCTKN